MNPNRQILPLYFGHEVVTVPLRPSVLQKIKTLEVYWSQSDLFQVWGAHGGAGWELLGEAVPVGDARLEQPECWPGSSPETNTKFVLFMSTFDGKPLISIIIWRKNMLKSNSALLYQIWAQNPYWAFFGSPCTTTDKPLFILYTNPGNKKLSHLKSSAT